PLYLRLLHSFPTRRSSDLLRGPFNLTFSACLLAPAFSPFFHTPGKRFPFTSSLSGVGCCGTESPVSAIHCSITFRKESSDSWCLDRKSTRLNSSHVKISYA